MQCNRCGSPAELHPSKKSNSLNRFVCSEECRVALQHRNTLELFEDIFKAITLVRLVNAREIESYERGCQSGIDMVEANAHGWEDAGISKDGVDLMRAIARWLYEDMILNSVQMRRFGERSKEVFSPPDATEKPRITEQDVILILSDENSLTCVASDPKTGENFRFHWTCCFRAYTGQLPKVGMRGKVLFGSAGPFALQLLQ